MRSARDVGRYVALLERYCPLGVPCRVVVTPVRWWADCARVSRGYTIRLSPNLDATARRETLAHEWAHAMVWKASRVDHGEAWGRAYSRCYRVLVEGWRPKVGPPPRT